MDKEGAWGNFKGGFGYHPLGAWLDNTNEALAALLRPGNAGSNTATDHLTVVEAALTQLPDRWRSKPILIRADGAGYSHALISALSQQGLEFSVGYPVTEAVRDAIAVVPKWAWTTAANADGLLREHADVVDVTKMLDLSKWTKTCPDMRVIVRRELPHPGATLDAFEIRDGYRYQAFTTNTRSGQLAFLEARHRAHARVEDRIRTGKDTGLGHLPEVILSRLVDHGFDLGFCVVDGVVDADSRRRWSARSDEFRSVPVGRVAALCSAEDRRGALFAEGLRKRVA